MDVIAGRVTEILPHPSGDFIWLARVDIGRDYQPLIVWGGVPVVEEGSLVPVALPGARVGGRKLRRRRYRGVVSEGMLCSSAELGWSAEADRVLLLSGVIPGESLRDGVMAARESLKL
jgi:phenylalanyl-tRNA synthetase beta chain